MSLSEDFGGPVELMVAYNQNDEFMGVLASSSAGMYTRADQRWFTISSDNRFFIGANVIDVEEDFLEFFDRLDRKGSEPTMKQVQAFALDEPDLTEEATNKVD